MKACFVACLLSDHLYFVQLVQQAQQSISSAFRLSLAANGVPDEYVRLLQPRANANNAGNNNAGDVDADVPGEPRGEGWGRL